MDPSGNIQTISDPSSSPSTSFHRRQRCGVLRLGVEVLAEITDEGVEEALEVVAEALKCQR